MVDEGEGHPSDRWLAAIAEGTMATYTDNILLIPSLPPPAAQQLITDIGQLIYIYQLLLFLYYNTNSHDISGLAFLYTVEIAPLFAPDLYIQLSGFFLGAKSCCLILKGDYRV